MIGGRDAKCSRPGTEIESKGIIKGSGNYSLGKSILETAKITTNYREEITMSTTGLIILIVVLFLVFGGGGGYYWSRRK